MTNAGSNAHVAAIATTYERIADLPETEARPLVAEMVAAEGGEKRDRLDQLVEQRLHAWASMEPHRARRVVSMYTEEVETLDATTSERLHASTKEAIANLPSGERDRLQGLTPELFDEFWPDRYQEQVGGRSLDVNDAHIGTAAYTDNGELAGHVTRVEGKYIQFSPPDGEPFWLSVILVQHASAEEIRLEVGSDAIKDFALRDTEQLQAGLDAPDPAMDERLDPQATEEEKKARREGLVRDDDGTA